MLISLLRVLEHLLHVFHSQAVTYSLNQSISLFVLWNKLDI